MSQCIRQPMTFHTKLHAITHETGLLREKNMHSFY